MKRKLQKIINKLTDASFKDSKINESQVSKSVKILKSLPQSEAIQALSGYLKELKRTENEYTMSIEAATPLSPSQLRGAKKIAEKKAKITKVSVSINKEILGGFKMRVGDEIWDGSVLGSINQVKEAIYG